VTVLHGLQPLHDLGTVFHGVELVRHQDGGNALGQERQHFFVGRGKAARLDHQEHHIHIAHCALHSFVERFVQGVAVDGLKTGCVHKHILRRALGVHARDAVARGLCLA